LTDFIRYADVHDEVKYISVIKVSQLSHLNFHNYSTYAQIYQFSLQIIYHPLKFTGLGLFYYGNDLLRKVLTLIIVLIFISFCTFYFHIIL